MGRSKSNRVGLATKYHRMHRAKETRKKLKKIARQNPQLKLKKKQDPGIPNLYPFKAQLIEQAKTEKLQQMEQKSREKDLKKALKEKKAFEQKQEKKAQEEEYDLMSSREGRRKWYFKELTKVIDAADVIIEVLDARDPLGCRAKDMERRVLAAQSKEGRPTKKLLLLLNKLDMVPPENAAQWITYLRREFPTIAFKSNTQKGHGHLQKINLNLNKNTNTSSVHSQGSVGASELLQLLKNYARSSSSTKTALTVGVIGYPNVGKSSVINSLKSQRVATVSPSAGCTKSLQFIKLDGTITLVDSPGVLFDAEFDNNADEQDIQSQKQGLLLRNALRADQIEDPQEVVKAILSRITKEQLMSIYSIADFKNIEELLLFIAHRNGKFRKGSLPDLDEAARVIINDWNHNKIPFHSIPPASTDITESSIQTTFSEAFDIDALLNAANDHVVKVIREGPKAKIAPKTKANAMDESEDDFADVLGGDDEDYEDEDEDGYDEEEEEEDGMEDDDGLNDESD